MKKDHLKGSVTVFLSLTLSFLLIMVLTFNSLCIGNAEKMRFEMASDMAFNSVLGEYSLYLKDRFDLLYIDSSYLSGSPGTGRIEDRLMFYMKKNADEILVSSKTPWGKISTETCRIEEFEASTGGEGSNMASQAVLYVNDSPHTEEFREEVTESLFWAPYALALDEEDPFEQFFSYMEVLEGMELPVKKNEKGIFTEVQISDPADWVYSLAGSDILFLAGIEDIEMSDAKMDLSGLISKRGAENTAYGKSSYIYDEVGYITYLVDKFGCYRHEREETPLKCSLEYIAVGSDSDLSNFREVTDRIFKWRFADNLRLAFSDQGLRGEAVAAAMLLEVCTLNPAFIEPVADTIVAACAFLETVSDLRSILTDGKVPLIKESHNMSVSSILFGNRYHAKSEEGLSYRQYTEIMIINSDRREKIMRTMDLMEAETRVNTGNGGFCMDWCIEEITASVEARGSGIERYRINRKYGYF